MRRLYQSHISLLLGLTILVSLLLPSLSRGVPEEQAVSPEALELRDQVRGLQQRERFEPALELLEAKLGASDQLPIELLREIHLLLVETHVLYGNSLDLDEKPAMAGLSWDEARKWARECLGQEALRDTDPRSVPDYPERGIRAFDELRREMFGSFRVDSLDPEDAEVRLDGRLLEPLPDESRRGALYVPVGEHSVLVRRDGYRDHVETIFVEGGSSLQKEYSLEKNRGFWWYTLRGTGVVAVTTTIAWLAGAFDGPEVPEGPTPLPDPPAPPKR